MYLSGDLASLVDVAVKWNVRRFHDYHVLSNTGLGILPTLCNMDFHHLTTGTVDASVSMTVTMWLLSSLVKPEDYSMIKVLCSAYHLSTSSLPILLFLETMKHSCSSIIKLWSGADYIKDYIREVSDVICAPSNARYTSILNVKVSRTSV